MTAHRKKSKSWVQRELLALLDRTCGLPDKKTGKHGWGIIQPNALVLATS